MINANACGRKLKMINWLLFANGCIIGMVFANNVLMWKKFFKLKDDLEQLIYFQKWKQMIEDLKL